MKTFCKKLYQKLPLVRDLHYIGEQFAEINIRMRHLETSSLIQTLNTIKASDPRYTDPRRLLPYGAKFWSQHYEDGMIAEIFRRIGTVSKTFLEIGVGDGSENNTTTLLAAGWRGWWIDGDAIGHRSILARLNRMPTLAARLKVQKTLITAENIGGLLGEFAVPPEVDLFSLDIDLNTYHIWAALGSFRPRVLVVEYNASIPPDQVWVHPYEPNEIWDGTQAFGASLKAYEMLGRKLGYSLVGCDVSGTNAFFVRSDFVADHFASPFTAENHYEPPRYHLLFRSGHHPKFFGESHNC